jgi:hypothetical protein
MPTRVYIDNFRCLVNSERFRTRIFAVAVMLPGAVIGRRRERHFVARPEVP